MLSRERECVIIISVCESECSIVFLIAKYLFIYVIMFVCAVLCVQCCVCSAVCMCAVLCVQCCVCAVLCVCSAMCVQCYVCSAMCVMCDTLYSPLQLAASLGAMATVVLLRSHGASVTMPTESSGPAHEAAANGHHGNYPVYRIQNIILYKFMT